MIGLIITIGIIYWFGYEAKKQNKNVFIWAIIGLASFWLTIIIPSYILIEHVIGKRSDAFGITITILSILVFLGLGGITCRTVLNKLKKNTSD